MMDQPGRSAANCGCNPSPGRHDRIPVKDEGIDNAASAGYREREAPPRGFFHRRGLLSALLLLVLVTGYILTPRFSGAFRRDARVPGWFTENILGYYSDIPGQLRNLSLDERMFHRHAYNYYIPQQLGEHLPDEAVFLAPPADYLERTLQAGAGLWARVPRVQYYFAGPIRTVYLADPSADTTGGRVAGAAAGSPVGAGGQRPSRMIAVASPDELVAAEGVVEFPSGDPARAAVTHSLRVLPDGSMRIVRILSTEQLREVIAEFAAE